MQRLLNIILWMLLAPIVVVGTEFDVQLFQQKLIKLSQGRKFKNVKLGIAIADLSDGKILFQQNEKEIFMPASAIKLILSAAAIQDYQLNRCFQVPVYFDGSLEQGVITGNVYLKGTGAPTILLDSLEQTVLDLKRKGVREIRGNLVYDDLAFKAQSPRYPPFARDRWAPGGALVLNSNRISLKITARTPEFIFEKVPNTAYAKIKADLKYSDSNKPSSPEMRYQKQPDGDTYTLKGTVTRWTERIKYLALGATRPGLYFSTVFKEALTAAGISVAGKILPAKCPENLPVLTAFQSPPLRNMLLEMNTASDNIIAENLLWKIGLDRMGAPSDARKGGKALKQLVKAITPAPDFACADGSGLSPNNQISPETFLNLLIHFQKQNPELVEVLPSEPLSTRQFDIRGKSGTLSVRGLNALVGYVLIKKSNSPGFAFVIFGHRNPNPTKLWSGTVTHPVMKALLASIRIKK